MKINEDVIREIFLEQQRLFNGGWPLTDNEVLAKMIVDWWKENADFPEALDTFNLDDVAFGINIGIEYAESLAAVKE